MNDGSTDLQSYITQTALENGALLVGYTKVRRTQPVIILAFPFSNSWILNHPFYITRRFGEELWHEHKVHEKLTTLLQKEGYRYKVKSSLSVFGDIRPLAIAAGIGQWGKNGLVVNKTYGSKLLFSALFSDAPFEAIDQTHPFEISSELNPLSSSSDSCVNCDRCLKACPGKAFKNGIFNPRRCFLKSIRGCSECIQSCTGEAQ
ncbi:hypothetical protein [Desulfitobacterium metallireducens]|uniref:4Fe-4S ferredoxin n=1 Tax=Desulfitobacterium metallireducens DSM 15288 TaxID=871968 RepID=W0ED25_9FIRM|nr:hypothetical protein [Desulfitobacterium metallireducens]AHF07099.1 4Fe-4S ferredoxin [Desulfitobacterium metallireducens DSM 15288]